MLLEKASIVNLGDEGLKTNGFEVVTSRESMWLCAHTKDEKDEWMKDLLDCIKETKDKLSAHDGTHYSVTPLSSAVPRVVAVSRESKPLTSGQWVCACGFDNAEQVTRIAKQRASLTKSLLSEQLMYRTRSSSTVSEDDLSKTFSSDTVEQQLRYAHTPSPCLHKKRAREIP
jgi:hypothetical protein